MKIKWLFLLLLAGTSLLYNWFEICIFADSRYLCRISRRSKCN